MTDRLTEIKARLAKASYDARPLKLHAGCKNPPNCAVCTEYNSARQEWEAYLGDLQIKAPSDIDWLIAELEKERAENKASQEVFAASCDALQNACPDDWEKEPGEWIFQKAVRYIEYLQRKLSIKVVNKKEARP